MEKPDFILITHQESLLIFLPKEIERAKRTGQSVIKNLLYAGQRLDDLLPSTEDVTHG